MPVSSISMAITRRRKERFCDERVLLRLTGIVPSIKVVTNFFGTLKRILLPKREFQTIYKFVSDG